VIELRAGQGNGAGWEGLVCGFKVGSDALENNSVHIFMWVEACNEVSWIVE
jgi:hypothetical protein